MLTLQALLTHILSLHAETRLFPILRFESLCNARQDLSRYLLRNLQSRIAGIPAFRDPAAAVPPEVTLYDLHYQW